MRGTAAAPHTSHHLKKDVQNESGRGLATYSERFGTQHPSFTRLQMLSEFLQDQAALYVSGTMTEQERGPFELVLEFHDELRNFVAGLAEVGTAVTLASHPPGGPSPSPQLKARIAGIVDGRKQQSVQPAMVVSGPDGLVQWVNPAFSEMCGYSLDELRGKKLGPILQGEKTDRETAARMREAVHAHRPCCETILNYHRNGTPYWVEVAITPIFDDAGRPLWLVARERELTGHAARLARVTLPA